MVQMEGLLMALILRRGYVTYMTFAQPHQLPHKQVSEGVDEGPPHQDPVMASPISRPESH